MRTCSVKRPRLRIVLKCNRLHQSTITLASPRKRVRFCCSVKPSQLWWGLLPIRIINEIFRTIPRPALNLPPLSKGGGLTASHKLSLCCIFTCDTSAFLFTKLFCRQDGGIASPPSLAPHQPFQKPYYPLRIANTLALLAPPVAPNTALAQDDN